MRRWDAVIVGAGPSGSIVHHQLAQSGYATCLIDGGPMTETGAEPPEVDETRWGFCASGPDCSWLRVRAVGGGSLVWGGWASRFPAVVFDEGRWPFDDTALAPYYAAAERLLRVTEGRLDERYRAAGDALGISIEPKRGALVDARPWTALDLTPTRNARARVVALTVEREGDAAVCVTALDAEGRTIEWHARAIVLAASPVETARLLLASNVHAPELGRLDYHLVSGYALIESSVARMPADRGAFPGAAFVPRFVNLGPEPDRAYRGGFSIELDGPHPATELGDDLRVPVDTVLTGVDRNDAHVTFLHGIGEAARCAGRHVALSDAVDAFGRQKPAIHLDWADEDTVLVEEMESACLQVADAMASRNADIVQYLHPFEAPLVFHESGTCAMGDQESTPCMADGRLHVLGNVWVADASAFPTPGDRHPTLTIAAHAHRVAESITRFLARS